MFKLYCCCLILWFSSEGYCKISPSAPAPRDCQWGHWGAWSQCPVTCGGGSQFQVRVHRIFASHGGSECPGPSARTSRCGTRCCPRDCEWSRWTAVGRCSVTCGKGIGWRTRTRTVEKSCGGKCAGRGARFTTCVMPQCSIDCQLTSWSFYSLCSASCGGGVAVRRRQVRTRAETGGKPCFGALNEPCNSGCCAEDCPWGEWGPFEACSSSCGRGIQQRLRAVAGGGTCQGDDCVDHNQEARLCTLDPCPVACSWQSWGPWSVCDLSINSQHRNRSKIGDCVGKRYEKRVCYSRSTLPPISTSTSQSEKLTSNRQTEITTTLSISRNPIALSSPPISFPSSHSWKFTSKGPAGGMTTLHLSSNPITLSSPKVSTPPPITPSTLRLCSWSQWTICTATCDYGTQTRLRSSTCSPATEIRVCSVVLCQQNVTCGDWGQWSDCNGTCANRTQYRQRSTVPSRQRCPLETTERRGCKSACGYSKWTSWNSCSSLCGNGTQNRTRSILESPTCVCNNASVERRSCVGGICKGPNLRDFQNKYIHTKRNVLIGIGVVIFVVLIIIGIAVYRRRRYGMGTTTNRALPFLGRPVDNEQNLYIHMQ